MSNQSVISTSVARRPARTTFSRAGISRKSTRLSGGFFSRYNGIEKTIEVERMDLSFVLFLFGFVICES
jgi:hypothetical protein